MKKIIVNSAIVLGVIMAFSQTAAALPPPPNVPDAGSTALLLTGSLAGIELARRALGRKKK